MTEPTASSDVAADGRADFDFIFGRWRILNRKLVDISRPDCDEWIEFQASSQAEPILGGFGHVDRMWTDDAPAQPAFEGFTLRLFEPQERLWRIWWGSSRRPGYLDPPVTGSWSAGRGRFLCDDVIDRRAVKVRFDRTNEGPATARWEQSFSYDAGMSWRTNWIMELTRAPPAGH
jgi:hypothetical protein